MPYTFPPREAGLTTGLSDAIVPGTGMAVPPGVESVLEYRGTYLNMREWLDTYLITEIEGLADADVRDSREVNPGHHGETAFNSYYGGRTIALTGKIRAHTLPKLRDMQQGLKQTFSDISTEYPLVFSSGTPESSVMIYCKKTGPIAMREAQTGFQLTRDFLITLRASNPRILSLYTNSLQYTGFGSASVTGFAIGSVVNRGNFKAQPQISIAGPINAPVLRVIEGASNKIIGTLRFTGNIPAGSTWMIDIAKRIVQDQNGVTKFDQLSVNSDWVELAPGENKLQVDGSGGMTAATTFTVTFRHTWL